MKAMMNKDTVYTFTTDTPLGSILGAASDNALCGLWFSGQKYFPAAAKSWRKEADYPVFVSLRAWLKDYFDQKKPKMTIPLSPSGTEFQQAVWKLLLDIPYGKSTSYGALAVKLAAGKKACAQAVGGAVGHNPISLVIPCHRVLGADGSLTGYAGGLDKKRALLELEGCEAVM